MNRISSIVITFAVVAGLTAACSPAADEATAPKPSDSAQAAEPATAQGFTGTVVETMDVDRYTYVCVDTGTETIWAATTKFPVAVGDTVTVPPGAPMPNFHSEALDRTFPLIYFVSAIAKNGEPLPPPPAAAEGDDARMVPHTGAPTVGREVETAVAPAEGGVTVADVHARAKDLAGAEVTVRGRVVKANAGIMGTNWYHIQDGTGTEADGTHDLTVTSLGTAAVGDVVTVTGTVAVDKDFGFGYQYPVIVENATIAK